MTVKLPTLPRLSRRAALSGLGAVVAGLGLPRGARASAPAAQRKFLFVQTLGGWDVTRVFAPLFEHTDQVDMEPEAWTSEDGDLRWVSHAARPSVDELFLQHGSRLVVLNGLYIPSISHHSSLRLTLTGTIQGGSADWATLIASAQAEEYLLPSLVAGGMNFAGAYGVNVARSGGDSQLSGLASGSIGIRSDIFVPSLPPEGVSAVDAYLLELAAARAGEPRLPSYTTALSRSIELKRRSDDVQFASDTSFAGQVAVALQVFSSGISRCVTVNYPSSDDHVAWDTHALNDSRQSELFEGLFAALLDLMQTLQNTPGTSEATLADETVIVLLSEMGRTPTLNGAGGKDHWPFGTAMLIGAGLRGGQIIGGFDEGQYGLSIDPVSGELDEAGVKLGTDILGATLLTLGGVDPEEAGVLAQPIEAVLE